MTNLEKIESQKGKAKQLTEEVIGQLQRKKFTSGRDILPGDYIIFGFIYKDDEQLVEAGKGMIKITMITLHEEEYGTIYQDAAEYMPNGGGDDNIFLKLKTI